MTKTKKPSPFSHVSEIYKQGGLFSGDEGYSQFVINKELSKNGSLIEFVNSIQHYDLKNEFHFKLVNWMYPLTRRPGFKAFPWIWKGSIKPNEDVTVIAKHFDESIENAKTYHQILNGSKEGKKQIKRLREIYGLENV
jgi:hypothetical protein